MIRVLHIVPDLRPGGGQRVAMHLLRMLDRQRFEPAAMSLFGRYGSEIEKILDKDGIPVTYLEKRLGFQPSMFWKVAATVARINPDVIHTHTYTLRYSLPSLFLRDRKRPIVHTVHNLAGFDATHRVDRLIYRLAFRHPRVTPVAIAEAVRASVADMYGVDVPVIPNGIPHEKYREDAGVRQRWRTEHHIGHDDVLFVNVGRLAKQKNQKLLVQAVAKIAPRVPRLRCLLVGDGPLASYLKQQAAGLGLQHKVEFMGTRTDIPEILAAADICVSSSDWEGSPMWVIEAMAAGKPIVATSVGGVPELVSPETGFLVPPGDVDALSDAMCRMAQSDLRSRMGVAATRIALDRFSVAAMTRSYEALYEKQLGRTSFDLRNWDPKEDRVVA